MIILSMIIPPFRGLIDCSARPWTAQVQRKEYITRLKIFQREGEFNRIQVIETFERRSLSVAAEILYDVRSRLGAIDMAVPARQT